MADIKSVVGLIIIVIGLLAVICMIILDVSKCRQPKFLQNNKFEILLLIAVSCIMGLVLIMF
ncbi:MAG: hypothetical protein ACI4IJ_04305 [Acutalibacteraceae bacterium]|nr:hypothetical protein [Bacillota bacterium]